MRALISSRSAVERWQVRRTRLVVLLVAQRILPPLALLGCVGALGLYALGLKGFLGVAAYIALGAQALNTLASLYHARYCESYGSRSRSLRFLAEAGVGIGGFVALGAALGGSFGFLVGGFAVGLIALVAMACLSWKEDSGS